MTMTETPAKNLTCWRCDRKVVELTGEIKGTIRVICKRCGAPNVFPRPNALD